MREGGVYTSQEVERSPSTVTNEKNRRPSCCAWAEWESAQTSFSTTQVTTHAYCPFRATPGCGHPCITPTLYHQRTIVVPPTSCQETNCTSLHSPSRVAQSFEWLWTQRSEVAEHHSFRLTPPTSCCELLSAHLELEQIWQRKCQRTRVLHQLSQLVGLGHRALPSPSVISVLKRGVPKTPFCVPNSVSEKTRHPNRRCHCSKGGPIRARTHRSTPASIFMHEVEVQATTVRFLTANVTHDLPCSLASWSTPWTQPLTSRVAPELVLKKVCLQDVGQHRFVSTGCVGSASGSVDESGTLRCWCTCATADAPLHSSHLHLVHGTLVSDGDFGFSLCPIVFARIISSIAGGSSNVEASVKDIHPSWASCSSVLMSARFVFTNSSSCSAGVHDDDVVALTRVHSKIRAHGRS